MSFGLTQSSFTGSSLTEDFAISPEPAVTSQSRFQTTSAAEPLLGFPLALSRAQCREHDFCATVGIVRWIEKLLFACASMSLDSCYSAH
jgi:hypothetical protein